MNKLLTILPLGLLLVFAFKNNQVNFLSDEPNGIQFYKGTWKEALELSKVENKLIFLDIYATWCGPCKKLKKETFSDSQVGEFYNHNFINVALDGENGEGEKLANKYQIKGYPSLLFIDSKGKIIEKVAGYRSSKAFVKMGKNVINK